MHQIDMARNLKLYATPFKFLAVSILGLQNTQQSIHTIAFSEDPQWVAINSKGAFLSYCIINILKYVYTRSNIHSSYILRRGVTTKLSLVSSKPKKNRIKICFTLFNGIRNPCSANFSPRKLPISQFIPSKVALL